MCHPVLVLLDAVQTHPDMRLASWALQLDSNDTRTRAFIHTHTGEKRMLREDQAAEKRKEGKRSPEACALMKASKTGPECTPAKGGLERALRG